MLYPIEILIALYELLQGKNYRGFKAIYYRLCIIYIAHMLSTRYDLRVDINRKNF